MKVKYVVALAIFAVSASTMVSCKKTNKEDAGTTVKTEEVAYEDLGDNSRTSLDWAGTYVGTIPCADCEGILQTLEIKEDGTYKETSQYQGVENAQEFYEEGKFEWDASGSKLTLTSKEGEVSYLAVHEGSVLLLDKDGEEITGALAESYRLQKK